MNITKTYKVAGHIFSIGMDEGSGIWEKTCEPYGPFETEDSSETQLFHLTVGENDFKATDPVYSNIDTVEPGFIGLSVYRDDAGHHFEFTQPISRSVNGRLSISEDFTQARLALTGTETEQWLTFNTAVNFCFLIASACHGTVLTHASCVLHQGKAYLFLGKSGTGKSTHSRMWLRALPDVVLMNDDHPVVRVGEDGKATAYGSPWSGKTRCYKNMQAPVGGIVRISRAPYNKARRLSPVESYASLMTSCSGMTWEKTLADGRDKTIQSIIADVPCWVMECLPDEDAAKVCAKAVTEGQA